MAAARRLPYTSWLRVKKEGSMSVRHLFVCAAAALLLTPGTIGHAQSASAKQHGRHGGGPVIDAVREVLDAVGNLLGD